MDIVFNSSNYETLLADAKKLGFVYQDEAKNTEIMTCGPITGGGSFFLNIVETVYEPVVTPSDPNAPYPEPVARPGFWGRLRINGKPLKMPSFSSAITQYIFFNQSGKWVNAATGEVAPDWVGNIGEIA